MVQQGSQAGRRFPPVERTETEPEPGGEVLFTGTRSEYANLYLLDIPEYESLPAAET